MSDSKASNGLEQVAALMGEGKVRRAPCLDSRVPLAARCTHPHPFAHALLCVDVVECTLPKRR